MNHSTDRDAVQKEAVANIMAERRDQDRTFGEQHHDPAYWLAILSKQFGQLGSAIVRRNWAPDQEIMDASDVAIYREAKQVAAVALALMEATRMGHLQVEITSAVPADPRQRAVALGRDDEDLRVYDPESVEILTTGGQS